MSGAVLQAWLGILTFLGVAYPVWIREKNKRIEAKQAERASEAVQEQATASVLIQELQEEVRTMRENRREDSEEIRNIHREFRSLQKTLLELEYGVKILIAQLDQAKISPLWSPVPNEEQPPE